MTSDTELQQLLDGALEGSGVGLDGVSVTPAGRRRVVKVVVDRAFTADGDVTDEIAPLSLDEIADATRAVSDALDPSDVLGEQPYTLEVTSPGVSRPLTEPRHFQRNVGRLVTVTRTDGTRVTGRIVRAGGEDLTLSVPAELKSAARDGRVAYGGVRRAEVQVEVSRRDLPDDPPADGVRTDEMSRDKEK